MKLLKFQKKEIIILNNLYLYWEIEYQLNISHSIINIFLNYYIDHENYNNLYHINKLYKIILNNNNYFIYLIKFNINQFLI